MGKSIGRNVCTAFLVLHPGLRLSGLFALGAGQGLIGWWMVKSGLKVTSNSNTLT